MARICASQSRDIVSAVILKCFSARSVAEQRLIYEQSRLFPKLGLQCGGRKFCFEWYERKLVRKVSSLIVKSTRLLSRARERKKRVKPSIYLSLRGLTRYFREREGRRSSITTRRLYRRFAYNVIPLA